MKVEKMKESRRWLSWLPKALLATLLAGALAFVGCKSDDDDDDDTRDNSGPDGVEVSVTLNETTSKLFSNSDTHNTVELIATVKNAPEATVTWESNAPSIATVKADDTDSKKATVTAEKAAKGTAIITVIVGDNLATTTCTITVSDENFVPVSAITITNADGKELTGVQKLAVNAELVLRAATNDGATEAVTWTSSNPSIAEVKQKDDDKKATVTAKKAGTVTITAKAASSDVKSELTIEVSKGNYGEELGSQKFEAATVESLGATSTNHKDGMTIETDSSGNHYFQFTQILDASGNGPTGPRNAYLPLSEVPEDAPYRLVFDAAMSPSNEQVSQFAVVTAKPADNAVVSGNYLLTLTSTQIRGTDASGDFEWTLNDENKTSVTLNTDTFYTFVLSVDTKRGYATLSSIDDANGDPVLEEPVVLQTAGESLAASGFNLCLGRSVRGCMRLDNIAIYEYTDAPRVPVKSVEITIDDMETTDDGPIEMGQDGNAHLTATVSPWYADDANNVTWNSSAPTTVKVEQDDKGGATVTFLSQGEATITATAGSVSDTITFNVLAPIAVTDVEITSKVTKIGINNPVQLTAKVSPDNASNKGVTWKTSDEAIATVDEKGVLTGHKEGTVKITATAEANEKATDYLDITVYLFAQDYEETTEADWTSDGTDRYTVSVKDGYVAVDAVNDGNNGTIVHSEALCDITDLPSKFILRFDLKLQGGNNQPSAWAINSAAGGIEKATNGFASASFADEKLFFVLEQTAQNATTWTVNHGSSNQLLDIAKETWYSYAIEYSDSSLHLKVVPRDGGDAVFDDDIATLGTGLGMMQFMTKRYYAGMAIDNVVVTAAQ